MKVVFARTAPKNVVVHCNLLVSCVIPLMAHSKPVFLLVRKTPQVPVRGGLHFPIKGRHRRRRREPEH